MHAPRSPLPAALLLVAALLGACASPSGGLSGTDDSGSFGGLRASWEVPRPQITDGRPPARQYLVGVDLNGSKGNIEQPLGLGESLTIDGETYNGPQLVLARFDVQRVVVDGRLRLRSESGLGIDGIAGLGFSRLDLETAALSGNADLEQQGFGPLLGTGVFFELPPRLRLFAELTWQASIVSSDSVADVQVVDLGIDLRLTEALGIVLAWHDFSYQQERDGAESDLDLTARGPRLTLLLRL